MVNDGPLSKDVVLSGATLLVEVGNCGNNIGGAAMVEPMLLQSPVAWGAGFASRLRSTGVTGVDDEPQLVVGGGAGELLELVGQGGGARLRVVELAGGAAG